MSVKTADTSELHHFDADGNEVYPCRCGETHDGPQGLHAYMHHNCYHDAPLIHIHPELLPGQYMCPGCGKGFCLADSETLLEDAEAA